MGDHGRDEKIIALSNLADPGDVWKWKTHWFQSGRALE